MGTWTGLTLAILLALLPLMRRRGQHGERVRILGQEAGPAGVAWQQVAGLTHRDAEDLLDWYENHGWPRPAPGRVAPAGFAVQLPIGPERVR
jgi:hypothetical protein